MVIGQRSRSQGKKMQLHIICEQTGHIWQKLNTFVHILIKKKQVGSCQRQVAFFLIGAPDFFFNWSSRSRGSDQCRLHCSSLGAAPEVLVFDWSRVPGQCLHPQL